MGRTLRIGLLLIVLIVVAREAWVARARTTDWKETLRVVIYPINADRSAAVDSYLTSLPRAPFAPIAEFLRDQAAEHRLALRNPVEIYVGPRVDELPPPPPRAGNAAAVMAWSLRLRYWAWRHDGFSGPRPHVRLFAQYVAPVPDVRLPHSIGLQKGLLGVVHLFAGAELEGSNDVVITHELLHTFGATDKYDPATNQPLFPDGYATPHAQPLLPQSKAELMAGRIPISALRAEIPRSLDDVVIGVRTAQEINWLK